MATSTNVLAENTTEQIIRVFLESFESSQVLTKTVDTQLLSGKFSPQSGTTVKFKRPHDFKSDRTAAGDISAVDRSDIVAATATGTVQNYITVHMDWDEVDEALKLDQLDQILAPASERMITDLELDFGAYMVKNCNLYSGTVGTQVTTWGDVANAGALMDSMGVPKSGNRYYVMNPYVNVALADAQGSLASGSDQLVNTAWQNAQLSKRFGNLQAMTSNALSTYTSGDASDRAGTITSLDVTYATNKDTMIQDIVIGAIGAGTDTILAGEIVEVTGRNRLSLSTRSAFVDQAGAEVLWAGVVTEDVTLSGGAGTIKVAGPGIFEANGQYNTTSTALAAADVITILGSASTVYQPNLFYHEQAFGIGSVPLKKLFATDTIGTTEGGMQIRVSRYSDGDANKQKIRFDLLPAYVVFNPFFAGQGFG